MTQATPPELKMQRHSRDASTVPGLLEAWLATELPEGSAPRVTLHSNIEENGLSSETLVLDVDWTEDGEPRHGEYVARVAPSADDVPVFEHYDLQHQYDVMRLVGELTDVPVPKVGLSEPTGAVLGMPFFLMERVEGVVPRDVMPYNFGDNWLFDATAEQQRRLQDRTVRAVASLHAIEGAESTFGFLDKSRHSGATHLARNLAATRSWYEWAVPDVGRSPLVERSLAWLEAHLPDTEESVLSWGDSRIGNVIYRDFEPVAVLDWEMATLGPRELDVSWLVFAHLVFQAITDVFEMPGMPDFLREDDVRATYAEASGVELGDLTWYHLYNGVQWCMVFMRTGARSIHFGEVERPEDVESLFHHKPLMDRLLAESGA